MTYLAFDTSTTPGSVAVGDPEGGVVARRFLSRRASHAALLMPAIGSVLDEAGRRAADLDGVIVGSGPGSFTGLRVAAATAKGLVHALDVPLYAFSSLAAAAVTVDLRLPPPDEEETDHAPDIGNATDPEHRLDSDREGSTARERGGRPTDPDLPLESTERTRVVLFDARGGRLYAAAYRVSGEEIRTLVAPRATTVAEIPEWDLPGDVLFCGMGAIRHEEWFEGRGYDVIRAPYGSLACGVPSADALIALVGLLDDPVPVADPARWEPDYLREWKPPWEREAGSRPE